MFSAAVVLFDAIPTGWVSKHFSMGLILLQRRRSDAVALQRWCIPKCQVNVPLCSLQRRCSYAVSV
jgi:hypothetical protein